ncbi:cadherin-7a, partial [Tachysurus ichikawai]
DPSQVGKGITLITVMDVNDNAPIFAIEYETFLCETAGPGQDAPEPDVVQPWKELAVSRSQVSLEFRPTGCVLNTALKSFRRWTIKRSNASMWL